MRNFYVCYNSLSQGTFELDYFYMVTVSILRDEQVTFKYKVGCIGRAKTHMNRKNFSSREHVTR